MESWILGWQETKSQEQACFAEKLRVFGELLPRLEVAWFDKHLSGPLQELRRRFGAVQAAVVSSEWNTTDDEVMTEYKVQLCQNSTFRGVPRDRRRGRSGAFFSVGGLHRAARTLANSRDSRNWSRESTVSG